MCLSPVQIVNPSKYVSLKYRDRFLLSVPCGHCAECQQTLSNQWFLRAWSECLDIIQYNGNAFIMFDTLTYSDEFLPHMDDVIKELPHISCFEPRHVRNFIESLRIELKRKYKTVFRYFLSSEYGSEKYTSRPHYHILFFVYGDIDPLRFSFLISEYWKYGRTDGIPWKSPSYVLGKNVLSKDLLPANYLRACRYVTKYVQKSCLFDSEINKRVRNAMKVLSKYYCDLDDVDGLDSWFNSVHAKRIERRLKSRVCQFHRQSKHFGESLLVSIDIKRLFEDGCIFMPSPKGVVIPIPLSTYYKRKLFYNLIEIDGTKVWQLNSLGLEYRKYRENKLIQNLSNLFEAVSLEFHLGFSYDVCFSLAEYVYKSQGRINAECESSSLIEKLPSVTLYNYVTMSDREHLGHVGIINKFIGNSSIGYRADQLPPSYTIKSFIKKFVIYDTEKEKKLSLIYYHLFEKNKSIQSAFELKQRLKMVYDDIRLTSSLR